MNGRDSKASSVKKGVHQGSFLSLLLFVIVMEALSKEFREGLSMMKLLHAIDVANVSSRNAAMLRNSHAVGKAKLMERG